jgi:hypothetical protein
MAFSGLFLGALGSNVSLLIVEYGNAQGFQETAPVPVLWI